MSRSKAFFGVVLSCALVGPALAFSTAPADITGSLLVAPAATEGRVKSIDLASRSFVIMDGDKEVTIRTNDATEFLLDGKKSTMADVVRTNSKVRVTHADGLASKVEANAAPKTPPPSA